MFDHYVYLENFEFLGPFMTLAIAQLVAAGHLGAEVISVKIEKKEDGNETQI
jgi:hypothetical protein